MRMFDHVIVEQHEGHWSAWFSGRPQVSCGGMMPADAIQRLLDAFGNQYDGAQIVAIDTATGDGHLEFLVPEHYRRRIPSVSMN